MPHIIDTHAWIDYFRGKNVGGKVRLIIEAGDNVTPTIVLAELKRKFKEWCRVDFEEKLEFIKENSEIVGLDEDIAIMAGRIRAEKPVTNMGLVDCILLALARKHNIRVLTGDPHFRALSEAEYIGA